MSWLNKNNRVQKSHLVSFYYGFGVITTKHSVRGTRVLCSSALYVMGSTSQMWVLDIYFKMSIACVVIDCIMSVYHSRMNSISLLFSIN